MPAAILIILLAVLVIIFWPLLVIWGLNTLFPLLTIPYTFWTWLSAAILLGALKTKVSIKK